MTGFSNPLAWLTPRHWPDPFELRAREERQLVLGACLEVLTGDELDVIELRHYQDRTFAEIAVIVERPIGAVEKIHQRALPKLRGAMEQMRPCPIRHLREVL